jgi:hypothetical protein
MPQLKKVEPNDAPDRGDVIAGRGDPAPSMRLKTSERLPFTLHQGAADEAADVRTDAEPAAQPFVKWVGGKRSLVNAIKPLLPPKFGEYYEPFVGGGALFFTLADRARHSYLWDRNFELVLTYQAIFPGKLDQCLCDPFLLFRASGEMNERRLNRMKFFR